MVDVPAIAGAKTFGNSARVVDSTGKAPHLTLPPKWASLVQPLLATLLALVNLYQALSSETRIGWTLLLALIMALWVCFARQATQPSPIVQLGTANLAPVPAHLYSLGARRVAVGGFVLLVAYGVVFWLPAVWAPRLASVSPDPWVAGGEVRLRGDGLCWSCTGEDSRVFLDELQMPVLAATPGQIVVKVPDQAKSGLLRIDSSFPWLPAALRRSSTLPVSVSGVEVALLIELVAVEAKALLVRFAVVNRSAKQAVTISNLELVVMSAEPGDILNFQQQDIDLGRFQVKSDGPSGQAGAAAPWRSTFPLLGTSTLQIDPGKTDHVAVRLVPPNATHSLKATCALSATFRMPGGRLAAVRADRLISFTSDHLSGMQVVDDRAR
jgi:hypothetical protein